MTHPEIARDRNGSPIRVGDAVALPWQVGEVLEVGIPRSTIRYPDGAVLGAANRLITVLEVAA
ncbi:mechanosensitive ion channel domain-containing protein [Leptolyngbya sp. FACHB-8]|uniref:mechanosensitive ion channel domain-containing protein n=1 Tax=unclassified Leptolyngbya TaxID=2650499 RepID=UPI001687962D|nr:mechanosensitive ion channel domain-containing protein [Leptolyngbya sp. FACHB-8]MBD1911271.1 hypothetical protein [Leptolyngbya sp. FACHB-8]